MHACMHEGKAERRRALTAQSQTPLYNLSAPLPCVIRRVLSTSNGVVASPACTRSDSYTGIHSGMVTCSMQHILNTSSGVVASPACAKVIRFQILHMQTGDIMALCRNFNNAAATLVLYCR